MERLMIASAAILASVFAASPGSAADRPLVVELFTSEGCSSCPPADALLTDMVHGRRDVLPLAFHVTYWDYLGWRDPFSLSAATERQSAYATARRESGVFTPNLVVEGHRSVVGSDESAVNAAIAGARSGIRDLAAVRLRRSGSGAQVEVTAGTGRASVVLVGFDPEHVTSVARGENRGRTLRESNVVRSVRTIGSWTGAPLSVDVASLDGEDAAVLLQEPGGRIVGAARLEGRRP